MNKYDFITLNALLILVVALPLYAWREPVRMDQAQQDLRQQYLADGAAMYVENCAYCHGAAGEGLGVMPPLNNPALTEADSTLVYDTIAHSPHGSKMAAWHIDEGGILNDYQVKGLVALLRHGDWPQVKELAQAKGFVPPAPAQAELEFITLEGTGEPDPHECRACHEDPPVHADRFGLNCARCHSLTAWKPAYLTQHIFFLDHGDQGQVACETCHTDSYVTHSCYGCHDHQPEQMETAHVAEGIVQFETCIECHPTGQAGEAERLRQIQASQENSGPLFNDNGPDQISLIQQHLGIKINSREYAGR